MKLPQNLKFTKPQVDQFVRANDAHMKTIGLMGSIAILSALITAMQYHRKNSRA